MGSGIEEHPRNMSLVALAEQCLCEINATRCGETHSDPCWGSCPVARCGNAMTSPLKCWTSTHLSQVVRGWRECHPDKEVACHLESEA